jgi:hypothetical protein
VQIHVDQILEMKDYRSYKAFARIEITTVKHLRTTELTTIVIRTNLQNTLDDLNDELLSTIKSNVLDFIENKTKYMDTYLSMVESIAAPFKMTKVTTRYTFNDSPAAIESDIKWYVIWRLDAPNSLHSILSAVIL